MDATDRKILALLQADASLSVAEIGNRVGLSSTPCCSVVQTRENPRRSAARTSVMPSSKSAARGGTPGRARKSM